MLTDLVTRLRRIWQTGDGIRRLNQLDDRLLADMGTTRAEISRFVRGEPLPRLPARIKTTAAPTRNAYLKAPVCCEEDCAGVTA
jgi:uncharacterized protein YjiS (DUF1127 family)